MKQWFIIRIFLVCLALVLAFAAHVRAQVRQVHRLDARYQQVQRGVDAATVFTTMNENTFSVLLKGVSNEEEMKGWWNETPLDARDEARIETANEFTARELFKTVKWVFTFDKNDKLVGKHRFD
jgi:hypothetical protein